MTAGFKGKDRLMGLKELSGGEKSVVAVCIILAIQKVMPSPFYLLDEIDSALDFEYRSSVARL